MKPRIPSPALAVLFMLSATLAAAQTDRARLMGTVLDGSGGALPGVTVTLQGGSTAPTSVVSDGTGRYLTAWVAPGTYSITFVLSGFETRTVRNVRLGAGQTVVLDQQLPLASLTETVEVTAPAPAPPPPPPAPAPAPAPFKRIPTPRPVAKPVDKEILASVCGPRLGTDFSTAIGHVLSHRDDPNRQLMGPADILRIDAGEKQGVSNGQNFVVRRRFQTGDLAASKKTATFGEQAAGLIQIIDTHADSADAIVVYVCSELLAGDAVERYVPQPQFFAVAAGTPRFDDPARITLGENNQTVAAPGQMMVIDRGIMQSVQRGQRLTIFRRPQGVDSMPLTIGDGVVIAVRADSATIRIERATAEVSVGDLVALHR